MTPNTSEFYKLTRFVLLYYEPSRLHECTAVAVMQGMAKFMLMKLIVSSISLCCLN